MVTLTIVSLLIFVPVSRRILSSILWFVLETLGIAFVVIRESPTRHRGL
jgi:hypothetical protein